MKVKGRVVKGLGESARFLAVPWVDEELRRVVGFTPFPGTLNVRLPSPDIQQTLKGCPGETLVARQGGFCDAIIFKASVSGTSAPAAIVLPLAGGYPEDILEIISPVKLKEALPIEDGAEVEVEIETGYPSRDLC